MIAGTKGWLIGALLGLAAVAGHAAGAPEDARLAIRTKQFDMAVRMLTDQSRAGSADAAYLLGLAQWNGIGTSVDRAAARAQLQRAAESGHAAAAFALAALLAEGAPAERAESASWLARAAQAGYPPAVTLQSAHKLPEADARTQAGLPAERRFEFARAAAGRDDDVLLAAVLTHELAAARGPFGRTLLFDAVDGNAARCVRALIAATAVVNATDDYGQTPLMLAAKNPDTVVSKLLLEAGAQADLADKGGRTALFRAAAADSADQVAALLAARARVDHADAQGATAVDVAASNDASAALDVLRAAGGHAGAGAVAAPRVASGLDPTRAGALYQGWAPLAIAAVRDDAAEVTRRLAAGAEVDAATPLGMTALDLALEARAFRAARVLIDGGASLTRKTAAGGDVLELVVRAGDPALLAAAVSRGGGMESSGQRLIALAARRGDAPLTRALLAAGAPAAGGDAGRPTPLQAAARSGDVELLKLLIEHGAPVDSRDANGRSALWYAAAAGSGPAVNTLLAAHAPVDVADRDGATPLVAAIRAASATAVERLLVAGASVDASGPGRFQPLRAAVEQRRVALLAPLLARKPSIDAADEFGDTALMIAARNGDQEISAQLLAAGADRRLRNRERATAAELAESRGFSALAQRLRD